MSFRCYVCDKGPMDGITVYRQNEKGRPAICACEEHDRRADPELKLIVAEIESRDPGRTKH